MNAIVTLAEFYGVTSDYLLGITENREYHPFPVDELDLDDDTIDLLLRIASSYSDILVTLFTSK